MAGSTASTEVSSLLSYLSQLRDADTGEEITSSTQRAALYNFSDGSVDNTLLKNFVGIAEPAVPCTLSLPEYTVSSSPEKTYELFVTYSKLAYAPCIRLICKLVTLDGEIHVFALEFHFNDCDGKVISDYQFTRAGLPPTCRSEMRFKLTGGTFCGFSKIATLFGSLNDEQKSLVQTLRYLASWVPPQAAKSVTITLHEDKIGTSAGLKEFRKLCKLIHRGSKAVLPMIGEPEYSNFPEDDESIRSPWDWINQEIPNPMVPLPARDTYSSLHEFGTQQRICAYMTHWEGNTQLQKLYRGPHRAAVYKVDELAILAFHFNDECRIKVDGVSKGMIRLPDELEIKASFKIPGRNEKEPEKFTAYHEARMVGLPPHDAFFVITSHDLEWFGDFANESSISDAHHVVVSYVIPHMNSFLLESIDQTLDELSLPRFQRWHPLVLCQDLSSLEEVDTIAAIDEPEDQKKEAVKWARSAIAWNSEQLKVLDAIHCAKGGVVACTGIAGTGKTTLQMVLAILFVLLGGRSLCTAPANSNGDHLVRAMVEFAQAIKERKIRIYRVYSASRKVPLSEMSKQQTAYKKAGHQQGHVSSLNSLMFSMWAVKNQKKVGAWECSIENGVLQEAAKGELSWRTRLSKEIVDEDTDGTPCGDLEDVWEVFRGLLKKHKEEGFHELDNEERVRYARSYEKCKAHLMALADIIITTNGNARSGELTDYWGRANKAHPNIKIKALGVFMDEVAKEQEVNIWNVLTSNGLPRQPDLVVLFGDPKQLSPVNTCSMKPQYNPFAQLNDISLMARLITHGFPIITLTEQQRMHPMLSEFVSGEFYNNELRNSSRIERPLEAVRPGLKDTLLAVLNNTYSGSEEQQSPFDLSAGEEVRLQYIEMPNGTDEDVHFSDRRSVAIPRHIDLFFEKIFPSLLWYFGEMMNKEVLIICGYGNAISRYNQRIHEIRKQTNLPAEYFPRTLTIDASQGQESTMVIVDGSMRYRDTMGFMKDRGRSDVAMTRAKEVLWILGGTLGIKRRAVEPAPFVKLKTMLESKGQVHQMR